MPTRKLVFGIYTPDRIVDQTFAEIQSNIVNLYQVFLPKVTTFKNVKKINLELYADKGVFCMVPENLDADVITIKETFDFEKFNTLNALEKKEFLLGFFHTAIENAFKELGLDLDILTHTYDLLIDGNSELSVSLCGTPKLNKKTGIKGRVIAEFFISYVLISVAFTNKNDEPIIKIKLFTTFSHHMFYMHLLKTSMWFNGEIFQIFNKSKEIIFQINTNGEVSAVYKPIDRDITDIKNEIRYFNKELFFGL